jgi:hypothetical protein
MHGSLLEDFGEMLLAWSVQAKLNYVAAES